MGVYTHLWKRPQVAISGTSAWIKKQNFKKKKIDQLWEEELEIKKKKIKGEKE